MQLSGKFLKQFLNSNSNEHFMKGAHGSVVG
jgi:hypothetical protein